MPKKPNPGFRRLKTMTLHDGLSYLRAPYQERKIDGLWVESIRKSTRLQLFIAGLTTCVSCGLKGEHFHIERHWNDHVMPFAINLYGMDGHEEVLMTWDHILPRSLGGSNDIMNAQVMCGPCNSRKGNRLTLTELVEIVTSPYFFRMQKNVHEGTHPSLKRIINIVKHETSQL